MHDLVMATLAMPLAYWIRLDGLGVWDQEAHSIVAATAIQGALAVVVLASRPSRAVWRYVSAHDVVHLARNITLLQVLFVIATVLLATPEYLPRSVPILAWLLALSMMIGPRILWRLFQEGQLGLDQPVSGGRVPTLLVGSGDAAESFIRAVRRDHQFSFEVVGLVEDDVSRVGAEIHGVPVLATLDDELADVVARLDIRGRRPRKLLIAGSRVDGPHVLRLVEEAEALGMAVARFVDPTEVRSGRGSGIEVRPIAVEDLLNRAQKVVDRDQLLAFVQGKVVLVTGAGGSIGSELVRQVCALSPASVILAELSELNLYQIDHEVADRWPDLSRVPLLCDVRDRSVLDRAFVEHGPEVVFHAAALKHVPMVEHNACQGVLTNVMGSANVADACVAHGVGTMVMISTDKAVNPTNVMGATKRLAECYCQALDLQAAKRAAAGGRRGTRFVTVRFGNVLGSSGSVVPLFQRQLAHGGPLTVTHPDIERYFMTIREAVQLVLQAAALPGAEGEDGKLFVLDMGEPVKIVDLARQMVRLAGFRPEHDIEIVFTGLRPGEKLFEELFYDAEELLPTAIPGVRRASPNGPSLESLVRGTEDLLRHARGGDADGVRTSLAGLVPGYRLLKADAAAS